jgi:hypothetical protein
MESLKERNAFFIEVLLQRPEEARSGYGKKAFIRRACNGKREIAPKKKPRKLRGYDLYNRNYFSRLKQ